MDKLPPWAVRAVAGILLAFAGWMLRDIYEQNRADHGAFREREQNLGERLSAVETELHLLRGQ